MLLLLHTVQGIDTRCSVGEVGRVVEGERTGEGGGRGGEAHTAGQPSAHSFGKLYNIYGNLKCLAGELRQ